MSKKINLVIRLILRRSSVLVAPDNSLVILSAKLETTTYVRFENMQETSIRTQGDRICFMLIAIFIDPN